MTVVAILAGLGALAMTGAFAVWFVLKLVLAIVLLPLRLRFWLLAAPLLILKFVLVSVGVVLLVVLAAAGGLLVAAGIGLAIVLPLLPVALLVVLTWALFRLLRRPATT